MRRKSVRIGTKGRSRLAAAIVAIWCATVACAVCACFEDDERRTPEITSLRTVKTAPGYEQSDECVMNAGCAMPMALDDGEAFCVVVNHRNNDKLPISSVKINGIKYDSSKFAPGSGLDATMIEYRVEDKARTEIRTYTVDNVMFMRGVETLPMDWKPNAKRSISVSIRPKLKITLNYMDVDYRMGRYDPTKVRESVPQEAYYGSDLNNINVFAPPKEYSDEQSQKMPVKEGGWIFTGWYTQPNGEGFLIKNMKSGKNDKGDKPLCLFWTDTVLYANFERMYVLSDPIDIDPIEYELNGEKTTFEKGVVVKNKPIKNYDYVMYHTLDIPDTAVKENIRYTAVPNEKTGMFSYSLSPERPPEYPIVGIEAEAFSGFNKLKRATVGRYVEEVGYAAFKGCTKLEKLDFNPGSRLKYVGDYAFEKTQTLGKMGTFELPSEVEYIGNFAFRDSGWTNVPSYKNGERVGAASALDFKDTWKHVGYKAFMNTGFRSVVFRPGCRFESTVDEDEGKALESAGGIRALKRDANGKVAYENRIGSYLFAACLNLQRVELRGTPAVEADPENGIEERELVPCLNVIPEHCFDINNYEKDKWEVKFIQSATFAEGLERIDAYAFYYQEKIPKLEFPASLKEIGRYAFYNNRAVSELTFPDESELETLRSAAFGNMVSLDAVSVTSAKFSRYGNGVFRGCDRMKCVFFENLEAVPTGFKKGECVNAKGADLEVSVGHEQSDFLFATGEVGEKEQTDEKEAKTYYSPLRVFCKKKVVVDGVEKNLLDDFKAELKLGKELTAAGQSTGTSVFSSSVFVHDIELVVDWKNGATGADAEGVKPIKVAFAEVRKAAKNGNKPSATGSQFAGYALVYWSERSEKAVLPSIDDITGIPNAPIVEIAQYALPTSVCEAYIPKSYKIIAHDAFNGCVKLRKVEFEDIDALEYIGDYAFFNTSINGFEGGKGLRAIGRHAFNKCKMRWIDLRNTPIVNKREGAMAVREMYIDEYELEDNEKDYNNCIGESAFQGCPNLECAYLPSDIQQLRTGTFANSRSLKHVVIPTEKDHIVTDSSSTNDDAFYQYNQPESIYPPKILNSLNIYVPGEARTSHNAILPGKGAEKGRVTYVNIDHGNDIELLNDYKKRYPIG